MTFRASEKLETYQMMRFPPVDNISIPENNDSQRKKRYIFTINDRSTFFDYFNGYFEVTKKLQKKADGSGYAAADRISIINGSHSIIEHMVIKSAGKIIYNSNQLHKIVNVKNLLEYSDNFSKTGALKSFWHLDTEDSTANTNSGFEKRRILTQAVQNNGNGGAKSINEILPLNRYNFFEELEDRMLPPMQLTFELDLTEDYELIHKAAAADDGRVVVTEFYLWLPRMVPKDIAYNDFLKDFLKPIKWTYMKDMYIQSANTRTVENVFQISPAIENVRHVFIYLQRANAPNNQESERTPYIFNTFKLNAADNNSSLASCRLEYGNGGFFPEMEYETQSKMRIFNDLMSYAYRKNDLNTGTPLNPYNFTSLYGLVYFDLTYQKDTVTRDPKKLVLNYRLNTAPAADVKAHAIVFYESEVIVDKVGNELMLV